MIILYCVSIPLWHKHTLDSGVNVGWNCWEIAEKKAIKPKHSQPRATHLHFCVFNFLNLMFMMKFYRASLSWPSPMIFKIALKAAARRRTPRHSLEVKKWSALNFQFFSLSYNFKCCLLVDFLYARGSWIKSWFCQQSKRWIFCHNWATLRWFREVTRRRRLFFPFHLDMKERHTTEKLTTVNGTQNEVQFCKRDSNLLLFVETAAERTRNETKAETHNLLCINSAIVCWTHKTQNDRLKSKSIWSRIM